MMPTLIGNRLVEQIFLAVDFHQADDVILRLLVELAAAVARIDESAEANARDMAGPVRGDVAEQMRDHALRQIIGLDLVGDGEMLQLRHQAPVAADDSAHEPLVREMVQSALLAVALACRIDQCQIARMARRRGFGVARGNEPLLDRDGDFLGEADADEASGRQRVAIADEFHRVGC